MRFVLCILVAFVLSGCSTPPVSKVQDTINKDYSGKELGGVLSELNSDGYFFAIVTKKLKATHDLKLSQMEHSMMLSSMFVILKTAMHFA
ncbi:hypothetical protein [Vibrio fluvialis]|uniref:hypothetical protein n=1 Tax=Vibrio fluvialis TaxID=676 RepID=UPI002B263958|nr:hypothetical protein [Vibrio fluvialis]WPK55249.1 hypothetical protein NAF16_16265 [Vibrio fluvialis]